MVGLILLVMMMIDIIVDLAPDQTQKIRKDPEITDKLNKDHTHLFIAKRPVNTMIDTKEAIAKREANPCIYLFFIKVKVMSDMMERNNKSSRKK